MCGYHRAKMLAGDPTAEQICIQLCSTDDSLLPADLDSPTSPPIGEDEFFIGSLDAIINNNSQLSVYSMHVFSWSAGNASVSGKCNTQSVAIPSFTPACNGAYSGACVPQKDAPDKLDSQNRLMYRFAYWRDSPIPATTVGQHWLVNHDVWDSNNANAVRWYDFDALNTTVPVTKLLLNPTLNGTYFRKQPR